MVCRDDQRVSGKFLQQENMRILFSTAEALAAQYSGEHAHQMMSLLLDTPRMHDPSGGFQQRFGSAQRHHQQRLMDYSKGIGLEFQTLQLSVLHALCLHCPQCQSFLSCEKSRWQQMPFTRCDVCQQGILDGTERWRCENCYRTGSNQAAGMIGYDLCQGCARLQSATRKR